MFKSVQRDQNSVIKGKNRFGLWGRSAVGIAAIVVVIGACSHDYELLNGDWDRGDIVVTFDDKNAHFTQINSHSGWQTLLDNGTIRIGNRKFKDISKSSKSEWTCQELCYSAWTTEWNNCTITLSADGQTITAVTPTCTGGPSTYTKVQ